MPKIRHFAAPLDYRLEKIERIEGSEAIYRLATTILRSRQGPSRRVGGSLSRRAPHRTHVAQIGAVGQTLLASHAHAQKHRFVRPSGMGPSGCRSLPRRQEEFADKRSILGSFAPRREKASFVDLFVGDIERASIQTHQTPAPMPRAPPYCAARLAAAAEPRNLACQPPAHQPMDRAATGLFQAKNSIARYRRLA
jgi:hypothetical protein